MGRTSRLRPTRLAAGSLLALLAAASGLWAGTITGGDVIHRKSGGDPIRGVIVAESVDGIQLSGGAVTIPILGVASIDYYDRPEAFRLGNDRRQQGLYQEAVKYYETAAKTPNVREFWIKPACLYYAGMCLLEEGTDLAAAGAKFQELLDQFPKSRYRYDALLALGRVHLAAKKHDQAIAQFKKLAEELATRNGWEEWLGTAYLWQGYTYLDADKPELAQQAAKKALDVAPDPKSDLAIQARKIQAMVLLKQGEPEKAIKLLDELIRSIAARVAEEIDRGGTEVRWQRTEAQCYNSLGQAYLKLNAKSKKEEDLRQALLAFLWTVVLYPRAQFAAEHEEALYYAADCFEKLKQKARATELRNELSTTYPDSPYNRAPAGKAGKKGDEK